MAPKFALFTKGSKLPLNKGLKICLSYHSLALNPRNVLYMKLFVLHMQINVHVLYMQINVLHMPINVLYNYANKCIAYAK